MTAFPRLRRPEVLAYAAGSFGTGVFSTVPTVLLLYFCTEVLRIAPGWAAALVFLPKVWAIVWDPFVGAWSDRTAGPLGRRRPFLIAGAVGVAVAFVAVFTPPSIGAVGLLAWTAASYFALATLYSLFAVPYVAIPAEIGQDAAERSRLVSWRMAVAMIGVMAGAGVAPLVVEAAGGGRAGYAVMSLTIAAVCALAMTGPVLMLRHRDIALPRPTGPQPSLWSQLGRAFRHQRFRRLALAYVIQLCAVGAVSAAIPYLVIKAFGRSEGDIGLAMLAMLGATTLAVPVWSWIGRRIGETRALGMAVVAFALSAGGLGWAAHTHLAWAAALPLFAFAGLPFAGMQVLPYTLVADLIHAEAHDSGDEGVFTGVWTATEKLGLALGPALVGLALNLVHGRIDGLAKLAAVAPGVLALASLPFLFAAARGAAPLQPKAAA
ncbi:MFS transporter [Caulobacter mirabilis]|uniref:MFS transporter n=1 Tax=Caulobacter mirabilis TaxID=69666 RepID=A0A2D2B2W7_9CAUL|nr:MFS transporter [Caulobacter mirabilis]ATQ44583.1 hypothetical protein CSW64_20405 [Caulobacter mirabilis]